MCGITGFLDYSRSASGNAMAETVVRMADAIAHRGPDAAAQWNDPEAGIALGHRRLSIIDLSAEGVQPMHSACGRYVICYNGEIYNFLDLRAELEPKGHRFRGTSDTEVLLAAIVEWGLEEAIGRCIGMFAIALWDRETRRLTLIRDRLGIKPLYYGWQNGHLLFGSELKALRAHPAFNGGIDRDVLALYLLRNWIPAPYSIHDGIAKLPAGHMLTIEAGAPDAQPQPAPFWSLREFAEANGAGYPAMSDEELEGEVETLLRDAVRRRMVADVPIGVFLSGGVDSSTVTALMQAESMRPVRTFTIGFENQTFDEAKDAKAVAEHLGTAHSELYLGDDELRAVLPGLPAMYDEPFADSSQIPTYLVSRMARSEVTVCLAGDGGDEMFGGYNRYLWCDRIVRKTGRLPGPLRQLMAGALTGLAPATWTAGFDRLNPMLPESLRQRDAGAKLHKLAGALRADDVGEMYSDLMSFWRDDRPVVLGAHPAGDLIGRRSEWPGIADQRRLMMYLDAMSYLPDDLLTKVDRASMAVSLEVRVPMIDHRVAALSWRLPERMLFADGQGKQILRRILYRHVPKQLIERPKWGFQVPVENWLRGPLRDWAEDLLSETRLRNDGYLDPAPVRRLWQQHLSGRYNWQHHLWGVLMFQAWLKDLKAAA